jgi:hypothetical protein
MAQRSGRETRDKHDENVAARLMLPTLIDARKRLLIDASFND